jgi:trigger factor
MAQATAERQNKVSIRDAGPCAKVVSIEIPADTVAEKLRSALDSLSIEAQLPGFRKGRVPRWLIEKRFGKSIREEAKKELVTTALNEVVEANNLKVVGTPIAPGLENKTLQDGESLVFEAELEVLPEFTLPSIEGIPVRKPVVEITDAMVEDELKRLCINEGSLDPRPVAEAGDYLTGHAVMVDDKGTEFYNLKGAVVQKPTEEKGGKGMILGIMVDDFDAQMGTPRPGDTFTIRTKGPEQHEVEGIRNANLTITFHVERVDRIIPASVSQIVQQYGFDSEEALRARIRARMEERNRARQIAVMHRQIAKYLLDHVHLDLPQRLTAQQAARTLARRRMELMSRGVDAQKIEENLAQLRAASATEAAQELKGFFIIYRIAEEQKIPVHDIEVSQRIAQMAFQRGVRPEALRAELERNGQLSFVYQQVREQKTLDYLLNKASITEMPADEFNQIMKEETGNT